ncbi:ABC transporter ATP-binding protein [Minwuia sp.]|uniref:ABC transporter ATP-binding protein n=1 Tax=Minwuia sp. TaxID=2493630 RepID=UPI003A8E8C2B
MSIDLKDVTKRFGSETAVDTLSASVAQGSFFVVLGPSGCGKSTLLRLIAGLETLDAGEIALDGEAIAGPGRHLSPEDRQVGVVFQSYALWPHMSVLKNVAFPIESAGSGRRSARSEAAVHLKTVELTPYAERRPAELSGGQRQRVALARCLASGARIVLMDEPLANLDPHLRDSMETELRLFHQRSGATTLYITHDQREAMALADTIAVMRDGRFEQIATPHDVYARPNSAFVADFVGTGGVLEADCLSTDGGRAAIRIAGTKIDVACSQSTGTGKASVLIRPEWIRIADDGIAGKVETVSYRGGVWECRVGLNGADAPLIVRASRPVQVGETLSLRITDGWLLPDTH